jgi:hypothetical protein
MFGHRRQLSAALSLIFLAGCASTAVPSAGVLPDHTASDYLAADFTCTRASAEDTGMKLLNIMPEQYIDKCVRFDAFTDGTTLFVDAKGMRPAKASDAGLYWKDADTAHHLKMGPSFVTVVGRFRDCARHNAMVRQSGATTVTGACQNTAKAVFISEVQITPTAMD